MIDVERLAKLYGELPAVRDLSFHLGAGQILGLVGPNGAGKTTTLSCLTGVLRPTSGTIRIAGHDLLTQSVAAKQALAFVPDEPALFPYLSVEEHLRFIGRLYGVADAPERIPPLLAELELAEKHRALPGELSRGMKQKLALAMGLLHDPRALILDEPLTGLDPASIRRTKRTIVARADAGAAVILSSHLLSMVEELCTHILVLQKGRRVAFGTPAEIVADRPQLAGRGLEEVFLALTAQEDGDLTPAVSGAFAFLALRSARNWATTRLRKVLQPRYLVALLAVGAYFWILITRPDVQPQDRPGAPVGDAASVLMLLATLALVLPVTWWWVGRADRSALAFSPAETQWLFPAPVPRRALILWKLARAQLPLLFNVLLFTLFFRRGGGTVEAAVRQAVGFWLLLTVLHLHRLGAALTHAGATEHGRAGIRRFGPGFALVLIGLLLLVVGAVRAWPGWSPEQGIRSLVMAVTTTFQSPLPALVLAPFTALLAPIFAAGPMEWLRAAAISLLILLLHLAWVVRTDAAFEDAAAEASARQAEQLTAYREGQSPMRGGRVGGVWFPLAPTGHPAIALLWKNTAAITSGLRPVLVIPLVVLVGVPAFLLATEAFPRLTFGGFVAVAALLVLAYSLLFGPLLVRNDLRSDLLHATTLRAYPLRGETLVLVEIASSAAVLAVVQFAALLLAFVATLGEPTLLGGTGMRTALLLAGLVLLPAVSLLAVAVQNGITLLFPDWVRLGPKAPGGIEAMGEWLVVAGGSLLLLALLLLVPCVAGGVIAGLVGFRWGTVWAPVPGAWLAAGLIAMEMWFLTVWLGRVWEPTERITPE